MPRTNQKSFFDVIDEGEEALCRALWLSVILQAILDAKGKFGNSVTQTQAKIWLRGRNGIKSELASVCHLANVDFEATRKRCHQLLQDDALAIDFRSMKRDKENSESSTPRNRFFRRARHGEQIRIAKRRSAIYQILGPSLVLGNEAANDNLPKASNDNSTKASEEKENE